MVFRRRPFRRRRPMGFRRKPFRREALNQLRLANQLFEQENWQQAAESLEPLALVAADRQLPQAPRLFLRAARARLAHGDHQIGVEHLHRAVKLFGEVGLFHRLEELRPRILGGLKELDLEREAVELDRAIHQILDQAEMIMPAPGYKGRGRFPAKCSSCGASMHPDVIDVVDAHTAACGYCGSINQAI